MHDKKYISTPPLDIQKSKDKMQILHDLKIKNTNLYLILSIILSKIPYLNFYLMKNSTKDEFSFSWINCFPTFLHGVFVFTPFIMIITFVIVFYNGHHPS
jgi:hypothetical protein